MNTNPFQQPLPPRKERCFKARLSSANDQGKDDSLGHPIDVIASNDFVWLGSEFSVPLQWVTDISPVGPGFRIAWHNLVTDSHECAYFCARFILFYSKKGRDRAISELSALVKAAENRPNPILEAAASAPICQICSSPDPYEIDFTLFFSAFVMYMSRPQRRLFCASHARTKVWAYSIFNIFASCLGIPGLVTMPIINFSLAKSCSRLGIISSVSAYIILFLSLLPVLSILMIVTYAIFWA